jgi:hypothetical protein
MRPGGQRLGENVTTSESENVASKQIKITFKGSSVGATHESFTGQRIYERQWVFAENSIFGECSLNVNISI